MALSKNENVALAVGLGIVAGFLLGWWLLLKKKNDAKAARITGAQGMVGKISVEHGKELQAAIDDYAKFEPGEIAAAAVGGVVAAVGVGYIGASLGAGTLGVIAVGGLGGAAAVVAVLWYLQSQDEKLLDKLTLQYGDEAAHPLVPALGGLTPEQLRARGGQGYDPEAGGQVIPIVTNSDADAAAAEGAVAGGHGVAAGVGSRLRRALGR